MHVRKGMLEIRRLRHTHASSFSCHGHHLLHRHSQLPKGIYFYAWIQPRRVLPTVALDLYPAALSMGRWRACCAAAQVAVASGTVDIGLGSDTGGALTLSAQYAVVRF